MIDTQLVLIEGVPGSGKSTTATRLATQIKNLGQHCNCFLEWDTNHPIFIGYEKDTVEIISSAAERFPALAAKWEKFATDMQATGTVSLIESRFWQTGIMFLYLAGQEENEVMESHRRIIEAIEQLKPVLIYLTHNNTRQALERTFQIRGREWEQSMLGIVDQVAGVRNMGLKGREGWFEFFSEWIEVAQRLYHQFPFPKLQIQNPHADWDSTYREIWQFLELA